MSHRTYLSIISGQTPGVVGGAARLALMVLSWPYAGVVRARNHLYTTGRLKAHHAGASVICIGNLTTGGTGKTPLVVWLCRYLRDKQVPCAILTRGYKMHQGQLSDEPALLSAQCPEAPIVVNPDRVAGADEAIREHGARALVMDDGFQHRRLARDLDLVAVDATEPFGYGRLLPAGLLREPVRGLQRAHAVVLTRCDQVPPEALERVEHDIRRINPRLVLARSIHAPTGIRTRSGTEVGLDDIRGKRLFAFCGIGNPQSFLHTVEHLGSVLAGSRLYDDHCRYTPADLEEIRGEAAAAQASLILTTQKDWTKVSPWADSPQGPPLACLTVELRITAGAERLTALIDGVLGGIMPPRQESGPGG